MTLLRASAVCAILVFTAELWVAGAQLVPSPALTDTFVALAIPSSALAPQPRCHERDSLGDELITGRILGRITLPSPETSADGTSVGLAEDAKVCASETVSSRALASGWPAEHVSVSMRCWRDLVGVSDASHLIGSASDVTCTFTPPVHQLLR
jgi:hypothetical protein